jgi:hypothetical protein
VRLLLLVLVSTFLLAQLGAAQSKAPETSCTACHRDADLFDPEQLEVVTDVQRGVHAQVNLSCHDCHGGNQDPQLAEDMDAAMDPTYAANPYRGVPEVREIPDFCGRCHSDPSYMKRFKPDARVDQVQEYWTSQHGLALLRGDRDVATCVGCHGVHGILAADDPESWVYPTRVADTCGSCHSDAAKMSDRVLPNGQALPIDQYAKWRRSVHSVAMYEQEDLSAPTCNDCHGNHGATPPGLESVTFVCGQCHGREASIFRDSPKHAGFGEHNEFLADVGEESCAACHESPQAEQTSVHTFTECTVCHGNHGVIRPTVAMFAALPETPCAFCHEAPAGSHHQIAEPIESQRHYREVRDNLLVDARAAGLDGVETFDWLADVALELPAHTVTSGVDGQMSSQLRPEFDMLFTKFRIGKSYYTYKDPVTGAESRADVTRCNKCHITASGSEESPPGALSGAELVERMRELTALSARAERILLSARRGGVETREALLDIDQAVDSQISLEVLVHTFSTAAGSPFMEQHREGIEHANSALAKGQSALDELQFRRRGLAISLVLIIGLLLALGLKIRQISNRS